MTPSRLWTLFTSRLAARLRADLKDDRGVVLLVLAVGLLTAATTVLTTKVLQNETFKLNSQVRGTTNFGKIEQALISHFVADTLDGNLYRLPCPSDPAAAAASFGTYSSASDRPAATSTSCNRNRGIVPYKALGLSPEDVKDGYGNYLTYVVSTNTSACNGTSVNTGSVADADGATDANSPFRFVLISHGENGAGAWRDNGNGAATLANDSNMSDAEDFNCPSGTGNACAATYGTTSQSISIRTQNLSEGAGYYDDTVFEPAPTSRYYVGNCDQFFGETAAPAGNRLGFDPANALNFSNSNTSGDNEAPTIPSTPNVDVDGNGTNESYVVNIGDTGTASGTTQVSVIMSKLTVPLLNHTVRFFTDVYFQQDTSADSATLGNGIVFGFIGGTTTAEAPSDVSNPPDSGGTDGFNGFADESGNSFNSNLERFGVEIDTKNHRDGTPADGEIIDPDENHLAIVLGDVDHYNTPASPLTDNSGESGEDQGPVCVRDTDLTTYGLSTNASGTAPEDRATVPSGTNTTTYQVGSPFPPSRNTADNTDDEACLYIPGDNTWLEDGNPVARNDAGTNPDSGVSGVATKSHKLRIEIHGYDGSNGCGAGFVRLDAWLWPTGTSCPATPTTRCTDLTQNFPTATQRPHVSQCIARPASINTVRLVMTSGIPAGANTEGDIALRRTGIFSTEVLPTGTKNTAATSYAGDTITEEAIRNGLYPNSAGPPASTPPSGDLDSGDFDQSFAYAEPTDDDTTDASGVTVSVASDFGTFDLDEDEGWGVEGVGFSASEIDNIRPGTGNYTSFTDFLPAASREKAVFTWSNKINQATVVLKDFADQEYTTTNFTTDNNDPQMERVRLRAYDTTTSGGFTQVGSDQIVESCYNAHSSTFPSPNVGRTQGMAISTNFGGAFDRLEIIPEPILDSGHAQYLNSYSQFVVGAVRGCGSGLFCGLSAADITAAVNETRSQCVSLTVPAPGTTGTGVGTEVRPDTFQTTGLAGGGTSGSTTNHAWIDVTSTLGYSVESNIGQIVFTTASLGGFGISSALSGTIADSVDTIASPNGNSFETDREKVTFRFTQSWNRFAVGLARFGRPTLSTAREMARIRLYSGSTLVGSYTTPDLNTIGGSCDFTTGSNNRFEVQLTSATAVDRVEITAMPNTSSTQSSFTVRGIQPCDGSSYCVVDFDGDDDLVAGNPDNDSGDRFCQAPSQTCSGGSCS